MANSPEDRPGATPQVGGDPVTRNLSLPPTRSDHSIASPETRSDANPVTEAAPTPEVPGFDILAEVGRGGMGVVYKARQQSLKRLVALKMILSGSHAGRAELERFRAEAEVIARLQHPNIVQIYEIGQHAGLPFIALEFIEGGSLAARLAKGPQPPEAAAAMIETLARAVHAAHGAGIVHRDLKPANILMSGEGRGASGEGKSSSIAPRHSSASSPKITDFGLAKRLDDVSGRTRDGEILGTPSYMAPEQASGQLKLIGPGTDIYALGAILYEMLAGKPPFQAETLAIILHQVINLEPVPPSRLREELPHDLETICLKCLRKEPGRRYGNAEELADDLRRFLDGEPILARPVPRWERAYRWVRRHPLVAGLILALAICVPALVTVWLRAERLTAQERERMREEVGRDYSAEEVAQAAARVRRTLFQKLASARAEDGWLLCNISPGAPPEREAWTQGQGLCAVLGSPDATLEELRTFIPSLGAQFAPGQRIERDGVKYGWRPNVLYPYTQSEPAMWMAAALARALGRPGLLSDAERPVVLGYLQETQAILRTYRPEPYGGAWHMLPNAKDPERFTIYASALVLFSLLETKAAGLPWEGSAEKRDEYLKKTAAWLINEFDNESKPPGWDLDNKAQDRILEGETLQIYAILLRAEAEADIKLPPAILSAIPLHLLLCSGRTVDSNDTSAYSTYVFRDHNGVEQLAKQNLTYLWYPWAIETGIRWLARAERKGDQFEETHKVRQVVGEMIVELANEAAGKGTSGFLFIISERLLGLSRVPLLTGK